MDVAENDTRTRIGVRIEWNVLQEKKKIEKTIEERKSFFFFERKSERVL